MEKDKIMVIIIRLIVWISLIIIFIYFRCMFDVVFIVKVCVKCVCVWGGGVVNIFVDGLIKERCKMVFVINDLFSEFYG